MTKTPQKEINRFKALAVFSDIAKKHPVSSWQIEGLDIWPIFKILIVFNISRRKIWSSKNNSPSLFRKISNKVKGALLSKPARQTVRLQSTDILFAAAQSHDVQFKGRLFNRFFEPLIEDSKLHTTYLQYCETEDSAFESRHYNQCAYASAYNTITNKKSTDDWWLLFQQLPFANQTMEWLQTELEYTPQQIRQTVNTCHSIASQAANLKVVLAQIRPKIIFILNYYGPQGLAFVHAARQLGIPSVDMQHGPQVMGNSGYTSWEEIPQNGYNVLPDTFWVWDEQSKQNIDQWANKSQAHKVVLGGNPWCDFWKVQIKDIQTTSNGILYSLQPIKTADLFPAQLTEFIRTATQYQWTLRYHPRQSVEQIQEIEQHLKQHGILKQVAIEDAVQTPLPLSIAKSKIGITNYSGVAIESADLGKQSIIIHPLGKISFSNLIAQGKAIYLNDLSQLQETVEQLMALPEDQQMTTGVSPQIFQQLIESAGLGIEGVV